MNKKTVKELMDILNRMIMLEDTPKHNIRQLIDAHLNLVVMYCDHIQVDPVAVLDELTNRIIGGDCEDPFADIDDSIIN